ncbi:MAG: 2Fe-2S iron-sulfur cluster-binding protein [Myxococcota bacterium]|nr:2Fe-2S iron-sulfur cluster-binding protein [Myxococcota bacterium]MDW8361487.1 2Fe-2S iron-sulfur cluster-binding protein [Myxococcales bacterium]
MTRVVFRNVGLEAEVDPGASILEAARACGAPEGDRCGGVCACSTCHVYVVEGMDRLSEPEDEELDVLEKAFDPRASSRLGCQARIQRAGTIVVDISEESFRAFCDEHPAERERVGALWRRPGDVDRR